MLLRLSFWGTVKPVVLLALNSWRVPLSASSGIHTISSFIFILNSADRAFWTSLVVTTMTSIAQKKKKKEKYKNSHSFRKWFHNFK